VRQVMADIGSSEPIFEILGDNFKVTLFPIRETKSGGVSGGASALFDFIRANPGLKTKDIKAEMDLPQRTMERWIRELREQHKIRFQGPSKTGGYYPIE
jgi:ATP-dependent DNA helicase RecG